MPLADFVRGTRSDLCSREAAEPSAGCGVCSTRRTLAQIASFLKAEGRAAVSKPAAAPAAVVKAAAAELDCGTEACVVRHPRLASYIARTAGPAAAATHAAAVEAQLKPAGPRNSDALLSNFDIDGVLARWAAEFPSFFNCPYAMMDFETEPYLFGRLSLAEVAAGAVPQAVFAPGASRQAAPARRPCDTFACVLNTDTSAGAGKHWVCVFADLRGERWAVEYFNSAGNPPPRPVARWMEEQAARAGRPVDTFAVTDVAHQRSDTECGVYALFYVRARLEGTPAGRFGGAPVPDSEMLAFRKHLFSE